MYVIDAVLNSLSIIDPTGTLILRSSIPSFPFAAGLSILSIKGNEGRDEEVLQQHELEDFEERRD
jgi:hypothetical protein